MNACEPSNQPNPDDGSGDRGGVVQPTWAVSGKSGRVGAVHGFFGLLMPGSFPRTAASISGFADPVPSGGESGCSGSSTPCSRGFAPKILSKLGKPYFRTI